MKVTYQTDRQRQQLQADVEEFLKNGGVIQDLPPGKLRVDREVSVPDSITEDSDDGSV